MPSESEWTDADFVPRETESAGEPDSGQVERERMEWLRREIRSRLGAGEAVPEVAAWLTAQGCEPGAALQLISWAQTTGPSGVLCVEQQYETGEVQTDPIASSRARAVARRARLNPPPSPPNEDYDFAQPSDAAQARLNQTASYPLLRWFVVGVVTVAITVALVAFLMS